jgi:RimJ/RimL family protein N-acetyltransferase
MDWPAVITGLQGPRLEMTPLAEGDQALYARLYGDPQVMQRIGPAQDPRTAAQGFRTALQLNRTTPHTRLFWVIRERSPSRPLGLLGLSLDADGGGEVGVVLPFEHQGRGIATEAIAALAGHAFGAMRLQRLHTRHDDGHALAAGLMATLGFEQTAADTHTGRWRWQLTPAAWAASPRRQAMGDPLP